MKVGDVVRIARIPDGLPEGDMKTKSLFEACLGRSFPIAGFEGGLVALDVGEINGEESYMTTIYIEPAFLEPAGDPD